MEIKTTNQFDYCFNDDYCISHGYVQLQKG